MYGGTSRVMLGKEARGLLPVQNRCGLGVLQNDVMGRLVIASCRSGCLIRSRQEYNDRSQERERRVVPDRALDMLRLRQLETHVPGSVRQADGA
jgi:hypothetical protein